MQVVIKGGQLLPIRNCIEAFLNGDETALQSTLASSSLELQQMLKDIIISLNPPADAPGKTAREQYSSHLRQTKAASSHDSKRPASAMSAGPQHSGLCSHDSGFSAKSYVTGAGLGTDGVQEVALNPPGTASVQRVSQDTASRDSRQEHDISEDVAPSSSFTGSVDEAGCNQLVEYVLREFLGGMQAS